MSIHQGRAVHLGQREPLGYEQLTGLSTAKSPASIPARAALVVIQVDDQDVRFTDDSSTPTASLGIKIAADGVFIYTGVPSSLKFIEVTASAKINLSYYA